MTTVDNPERGTVSTGERWHLLIAMLVYAAGVAFYQTHSMMVALNEVPDTHLRRLSDDFELVWAGSTFLSLVAYAIGFMLLAGLLDLWTGRRPQLLAALNLALPAVATFELIKIPLLMMAFQVWFWATRV